MKPSLNINTCNLQKTQVHFMEGYKVNETTHTNPFLRVCGSFRKNIPNS